jgi:hypothetical protein
MVQVAASSHSDEREAGAASRAPHVGREWVEPHRKLWHRLPPSPRLRIACQAAFRAVAADVAGWEVDEVGALATRLPRTSGRLMMPEIAHVSAAPPNGQENRTEAPYNGRDVSCIPSILKWATFESLLDKRPNGSTLIVVRSIYTSVVIYRVALGLSNLIDPRNSRAFSLTALRRQVVETGTWLGPLLCATYASFYSRFSSLIPVELSGKFVQPNKANGMCLANGPVRRRPEGSVHRRCRRTPFASKADSSHLQSESGSPLMLFVNRSSILHLGAKQRLEYLQGTVDDVYKSGCGAGQKIPCKTAGHSPG